MFSKYFSIRYFPVTYFPKGTLVVPVYENKFDISSRLIGNYSKSGDIETIVGYEYNKGGDVTVTILKRGTHQLLNFNFDIETELE
jgi:hypothetical protein